MQGGCKDFVPEGCRDLPGTVVLRSAGEKRAFSKLGKLLRFIVAVAFVFVFPIFSSPILL